MSEDYTKNLTEEDKRVPRKPNQIPQHLSGASTAVLAAGVVQPQIEADYDAWDKIMSAPHRHYIAKAKPLDIAMFAFSYSREILKHKANEANGGAVGTPEDTDGMSAAVLAWGVIHPMIHVDYYGWLKTLTPDERNRLNGEPFEVAKFAFTRSREILREEALARFVETSKAQ